MWYDDCMIDEWDQQGYDEAYEKEVTRLVREYSRAFAIMDERANRQGLEGPDPELYLADAKLAMVKLNVSDAEMDSVNHCLKHYENIRQYHRY